MDYLIVLKGTTTVRISFNVFNKLATNEWEKLFSWKAKKMYNKCHSESRTECYKNDDSVLTSVLEYVHLTEKSHLFYNSPDCAIDVLSSSFIQFSLIGLFAFLMAILI